MTDQIVPPGRTSAPRFSAKLRDALDLLVHHGKKAVEACLTVGLHPDSLRKALKRPDVLAYLNEQYEVLRTQARARTLFRAEDLADNAQSEHVRLQANEWLAAIDGVVPVARGEIQVNHTGMVPGIVIVRMAQPPLADVPGQVIDQPPRPAIRRIGTPALHPSQIKREA